MTGAGRWSSRSATASSAGDPRRRVRRARSRRDWRTLGFAVDRAAVPDEGWQIEQALVEGAAGHALIVTTGGTGLTPRDVTPQATAAVIDYEVPGLAEVDAGRGPPVDADGRPVARRRRRPVGPLIVNVPGSPRGALESLEAIVPVLDHALETLAGPFDHVAATAAGERPDLPAGGGRG